MSGVPGSVDHDRNTQLNLIAQNLGRIAQQGTTPTFAQISMLPIAAPAAPASGFIIYVDATTGDLMAVSSLGNRRTLATP